jgi:hypothetical protein
MATKSCALAHKVSELVSTIGLTRDEVGRIVDASARSVARWQTGDAVPQPRNRQKLIELAYVASAVTKVLPLIK